MLRLRLKEIAKEKGLSRTKLSQRSEVSYSVVKDIFNNPYRSLNTDTLQRLARVLGVPVTELIEDVPDEDAPRTQK